MGFRGRWGSEKGAPLPALEVSRGGSLELGLGVFQGSGEMGWLQAEDSMAEGATVCAENSGTRKLVRSSGKWGTWAWGSRKKRVAEGAGLAGAEKEAVSIYWCPLWGRYWAPSFMTPMSCVLSRPPAW